MIYLTEDSVYRIDKDNEHDFIFKFPHKGDDYIFVVNKETLELTINHGKDRMDFCNIKAAVAVLNRVALYAEKL